MASSEQLEREAQATRVRIEQTLAELRLRISPGQIVDQAVDYARDTTGGDFVRNLSRQVAENPVPVALVGAGLVWLMMAPRRPRDGALEQTGDGSVDMTEPASSNASADRTGTMTSDSRSKAKKAADQAAEIGDKSTEKAGSMASGAYEKSADAAARAYDKAAELAGSAYGRASDAVGRARDTGSGAYNRARDAASQSMASARGVTKFVREEPLVFAGLGIALGAVIGALLPSTDIENRTMGERSDALKADAMAAAREQWEHGKEVAETGWDEAKEAARRTWEDAKQEAQRSWDETKRAASSDGHAGDLTGTQAPLVPSENDEKATRLANATERSVRSGS
ncbi:MAG TPA: DUF3618 domain-containing protein [Pseudolabrys sp.]|nr:DUF3618 domain-containing protein [Pseudolabrys sp.]